MKYTWGYLQEERETFQSLEILADFQWKKLGLPQQTVYVEKEQRKKKKKSSSSAKQEVCWDLNSSHNFSLMSGLGLGLPLSGPQSNNSKIKD